MPCTEPREADDGERQMMASQDIATKAEAYPLLNTSQEYWPYGYQLHRRAPTELGIVS